MGDAVFDVDSDSCNCCVELFIVFGAGLVGGFLDGGDGCGGDVGGICDPGGVGGFEEVSPAALGDGSGVMSGSWDWV